MIHETLIIAWKVKVLATQSCPTLHDPMDYSLPGSSVHGILQARILEWVAIPFSKGLSQPRDQTLISCIVGRFLTIWATKKVHNSLMQWLKHWLKSIGGTSLVVKGLRNCLPMKGTWVCFLVREDPTCTKPVRHNYCSLHAYSLCSATTEATRMRSPCTARRVAQLATPRESLSTATKTQHCQKQINKLKKKIIGK